MDFFNYKVITKERGVSQMAKHDVMMKISGEVPIGGSESGIRLEVWSNDSVFGHLHISKGGISWKSKNKEKSRDLSWEQFAVNMERE